jgi:hypothetical protein
MVNIKLIQCLSPFRKVSVRIFLQKDNNIFILKSINYQIRADTKTHKFNFLDFSE